MTETDKAYIAGILDGEGCITVYLYPSGSIKPQVMIANTNLPLLQWIQSFYGGAISKHTNYNENAKQCYRLQLFGFRALPILRDSYKYLRIKKLQADMLLSVPRFLKLEETKGKHGKLLTEEERINNRAFVVKMRALNQQGLKNTYVQKQS